MIFSWKTQIIFIMEKQLRRMTMKYGKIVYGLVLALCVFGFSGCAEKSEPKTAENPVVEDSVDLPEGNAEIGETLLIETDYGDFTIAIQGASMHDWNSSGKSDVISVRCDVENLSFKGEYLDHDWEDWYIDDCGIMKVLDSDGYSLDFFGISGVSDGRYATAEAIDVGEKTRISMPYISDGNDVYVTVELNDYTVVVPVE